MTPINQVKIPMNKKMLIPRFLFLAISLGFGILCVVNPSLFAIEPPSRTNNVTSIFIGGLVIVVFATPMVLSLLRKILDNKPALIIGKEGITKEYLHKATFVPWSDIQEIKKVPVKKDRWLAIIVKNPQDYIDRAFNSSQREELSLSHQACGSPIGFADGALKIKFDDLHNLLIEKMKEYKR